MAYKFMAYQDIKEVLSVIDCASISNVRNVFRCLEEGLCLDNVLILLAFFYQQAIVFI